MILAIGNKARGLEIHCGNVFLGVIQLPEALHAGLSLYLMLILLLLMSTFGSTSRLVYMMKLSSFRIQEGILEVCR